MKFKQSSNHFRYRSTLLVLLLLFAFIPFSLSGCGSGGGSGSSGTSSGASVSPNSGGGVNLSQNYTISGTVTGGSSNIPTGTVTLYILNSSNNGFTSTGYTGTINNGSYTISYPGTGLEYFMVMVTTPSGNTMYNIALGSFGIPNVTMNIDELTTAQAVYVFIQNGGTMSASSPGSLPFGSMSNYTSMYNSIPSSPSNTYSVGFSYNSVNNTTAANEIEEVAAALASCVQQTSYCSSITGSAPGYTASGTGVFIYILIENYTNSNLQTAMNTMIANASALALPWSVPAASTTGSATTPSTPTGLTATAGNAQVVLNWTGSNIATAYDVLESTSNANYTQVTSVTGTTATITGLTNGTAYYFEVAAINSAGESSYSQYATATPTAVVTTNTYTVGSLPRAIAIDASGNVWVVNASDTVTELNSSGTTLGTYTVGSLPDAIAIDASGNVWVANMDNGTVTELNSSGATLGTFAVGSDPDAIAIDASGNVWVVNSTISGTGTVTELNSSGATLGTYTVGSSPDAIAIDASGDVWVGNSTSGTVTELNSSGKTLGTFTAGSSYAIAIDASGNVWVANSVNYAGNTVTELNSSGSTFGTYTVGESPEAIAIDASGNVWVANYLSITVTELNSSGATLGIFAVGTLVAGSEPDAIAIDASGNVWVANYLSGTVTELKGVATGVKTPLVNQPK